MLTNRSFDSSLPANVLMKLLFQYVTSKPNQAVEEKIQVAAISEVLEEIRQARLSFNAQKLHRLLQSQQQAGFGMTPLQKRDCEVAAGIPTIDYADENKMTAIMHAAKNRQVQFLKLLLQEKAYVDFQDAEGRTALHWAAMERENPCLELLLEFKANPNLSCNRNLIPLLHTITQEDIASSYALARFGANLNKPGEHKDTPMHFAIQHKKPYHVHWLLEMKADTECVNDNNFTPLISAITAKERTTVECEMVRDLLEHKANPNYYFETKNNETVTAFHYAMKNIVEFKRIAHSKDMNKQFPTDETIYQDLYLCAYLFKYGYNVERFYNLYELGKYFEAYYYPLHTNKRHSWCDSSILNFCRAILAEKRLISEMAQNDFLSFLKFDVPIHSKTLIPYVYFKLADREIKQVNHTEGEFYAQQLNFYIQALNAITDCEKLGIPENYFKIKILQAIVILGNRIENMQDPISEHCLDITWHPESKSEMKAEQKAQDQTVLTSKPHLLKKLNTSFWLMTIPKMDTFALKAEEWFFLANIFRVYDDQKYILSSIEKSRRSQYAAQRGLAGTPVMQKDELDERLIAIETALVKTSSHSAQLEIKKLLIEAIHFYCSFCPDLIKALLDNFIDSIRHASLPIHEEKIEIRQSLIKQQQAGQYPDHKQVIELSLSLIYLDEACAHLRTAWKSLPPSPKELCIPYLNSSLTFFKNQVLDGPRDEIISDLTHVISGYLDKKEERAELQNVFPEIMQKITWPEGFIFMKNRKL